MSRRLRFLSDDELLRQCRVEVFRGSGPGGQKRNKTSNCIRLTHLATGVHAVGQEDRSKRINQIHAMRRLRMKLAIEVREPIDLATFEPPDWFLTIRRNAKIEASYHHPYYAAVAGLLLDLLPLVKGSPADVGVMLGISTTSVIKFLENEPHLWEAANHVRAGLGLKPLTHRN